MKIVHMVICSDCGYPAYEIEDMGDGMRKYYCARCDLKFMSFDPEYR